MNRGSHPGRCLPLATGVLAVTLWEIVWRARWVDPLFFAGPTAVTRTLVDLLVSGEIWPHYAATMSAAAMGLAVALVSGVAAGVAYGLSPGVRDLAGPYLAALNATPRVAMIGLFVIWLGLGVGVRVAMVAISAFFPVFFNTVEGVRALDPALDRVGRAYGCTRGEWFSLILLPHLLPYVLIGTRLAVARALIVVVIAEIFVGSLGGVGYFMINAGQQFQAARVFAAALLMAVTGCALTVALDRLGRWLAPWHQRIAL